MPSISSFSGTYGQGNSLTLNVSGTTDKNSTQLIFMSGVVASDGDDALPNQPALNASNYKHNVVDSFMGTGACLLAEMAVSAAGSEDTYWEFPAQSELYMSIVAKLEFNTVGINTDGQQLKMTRFNAGTGHSGEPVATRTQFWNTDDVVITTMNGDLFMGLAWDTIDAHNEDIRNNGLGNWNRTQMYWKASDNDVANGSDWWMETDQRDGTDYFGGREWFPSYRDLNDPDQINVWPTPPSIYKPLIKHVTRTAADSNQNGMTKAWLPFFKRNSSQIDSYVDGVFINDSLERVELGNASTWIASTKRVIQEQTNRGSSSIVFNCYEANFVASDDVYAFVFNTDGEYSTGHLIRAGA
jgi:hypothetical protein